MGQQPGRYHILQCGQRKTFLLEIDQWGQVRGDLLAEMRETEADDLFRSALDAASPASFQPVNAATSTGRSRWS